MSLTAEQVIAELKLKPHPEGGNFVETFRSAEPIERPEGTQRSASTAIYFLLRASEFSAFHRVSSDEVWHHYYGSAVTLELLQDDGKRSSVRLGSDLISGQRPQVVVPAGVWQAARPLAVAPEFALCGCTVAPGFEFEDFELPARAELVARFPEHAELIRQLTRGSSAAE
jgi:predicted cupin superfamily sugar epimerase